MQEVTVNVIRGTCRSRRPGQVFLKVVIPQTKPYVQQRKPDLQGLLEYVLSSHQFSIPPAPLH
jgi:hypothetical protein